MASERVISMLPPARRGRAQFRRVLALPLLAIIGGAGCSHPPLLAPPHRFVRLDALLPIHPSWEQVRCLDRELARLKTAPEQAGAFRYEPHAAVPIFTPRSVAPANIAKERADQIERDAKRYIDSLTRSLAGANQSAIIVERRREQRRVDAAVAARLAEEARLLQSVIEVKLFAIRERLKSLVLRDIVVKSRIQNLAQAHSTDIAPLREAQAEHTAILKEVARLRSEDAALRAQDLTVETARKRDSIYREELARSRERLARREETLRNEMREKIATAASEPRDTPIPPPAVPILPPPDPNTTPLLLPSEPSVVFTSTAERVRPALARQATVWQAQRTAIVDEIRSDTWKAVQQAALRRGWKLEDGPRPGASDATKEAADDLRAQWRMGAAP